MAAQALKIVSAPDTAADLVASAHAAGLRHVDDTGPGIRRRATGRKIRQGKRFVSQFVYLEAHGRAIDDQMTLERIRHLAIPPAWTDVWICPAPNGHIQATGRDARGRKQYRYHPRWREERDGTKYSRMIPLGQALPDLRRRIAADLRSPGLPRQKVLATVVRLLETTFIRVGNEEYARSNRSFGLTTLQDRHVAFGPSEVRFHFRGKSGVMHDVAVHDRAVAQIVRRCRDLPGQELFQYLDQDGARATIDSADVNNYIRQAAGEDFTAKDFRTWAGTVLAAHALQEIDAAAELLPRRRHHDGPRKPSPRNVVRAIERVAERLGNTPSVCRKCYVHPHVIASYLDGTLAGALKRHTETEGAARLTGLRSQEIAVLKLLQWRLAEDQRGTRLETQLRRSLRATRGVQRQKGRRWRATA